METNHGQIEHERNLNQGKRPDQIESSSKIFFWMSIGMIIAVFIHWLLN